MPTTSAVLPLKMDARLAERVGEKVDRLLQTRFHDLLRHLDLRGLAVRTPCDPVEHTKGSDHIRIWFDETRRQEGRRLPSIVLPSARHSNGAGVVCQFCSSGEPDDEDGRPTVRRAWLDLLIGRAGVTKGKDRLSLGVEVGRCQALLSCIGRFCTCVKVCLTGYFVIDLRLGGESAWSGANPEKRNPKEESTPRRGFLRVSHDSAHWDCLSGLLTAS